MKCCKQLTYRQRNTWTRRLLSWRVDLYIYIIYLYNTLILFVFVSVVTASSSYIPKTRSKPTWSLTFADLAPNCPVVVILRCDIVLNNLCIFSLMKRKLKQKAKDFLYNHSASTKTTTTTMCAFSRLKIGTINAITHAVPFQSINIRNSWSNKC